MTIAAGVLTHDAIRYDRLDLFKQTVRSLVAQKPDFLYLVSNGSTDGTEAYVASLGGLVVNDPISSCGHGMNVTMGACVGSGADVVVFSNDDIIWHPDALGLISEFWAAAPDDVVIAAGILEDDYPWNTALERLEVAGQGGLVRLTAPGGAWTFRARDWGLIHPIPEAPGWDDVPTCQRLQWHGYRVAQFDWAEHIGEERSTWGNISGDFRKPLDYEGWGIPCPRRLDKADA